MDPKIKALAKFLQEKTADVTASDRRGEYEVGTRTYLVYTDDEAAEAATAAAEDLLWAFSADYMCDYIGLSDRAAKAVAKMQAALCEDAQEIILALVGDRKGDILADAIATDGCGHFLATYDGEEGEQIFEGQTYYIYRTN